MPILKMMQELKNQSRIKRTFIMNMFKFYTVGKSG